MIFIFTEPISRAVFNNHSPKQWWEHINRFLKSVDADKRSWWRRIPVGVVLHYILFKKKNKTNVSVKSESGGVMRVWEGGLRMRMGLESEGGDRGRGADSGHIQGLCSGHVDLK